MFTFLSSAIAEELFKNQYSVDQRYVMFNALALGARELAGLPVAGTPDVDQRRLPTFPSKMLPPGLHARYVDEDDAGGTLALLSGSLQSLALGDNSGGQEVSRPRERRLRSAPSATGRITAITPKEAGQLSRPVQSPYDKPMESFTAVSVECFLGPLMGRFWNFVRDEQTRESRSSLSSSSDPNTRYRAAGTGMVLSPLVLAHLLRTVSVLVHASRHSLLFMAVVAPDALEMAVVLGTRPVSGWDSRDSKEREQEASVLHSSLELALITLDACLSIDGGRILAMEHSALILGVEEWAMRAVQELDKGIKFGGTGGAMESKLGRVAAGVVVKIDEVVGKWRRVMSMIGD
jgi:telomere length regulation protein